MRRILGPVSLLIALVLLVPGGVEGQDKKKKGKKIEATPATPQEYAQLSQYKDVTGKLVFADVSAQSLSFRLEYQKTEANPKYKPPKAGKGGNNNLYQQMQRLLREQNELLRIKNPVQRQVRMQQIALEFQKLQMQMAGVNPKGGKVNPDNLPYRQVTESRDFELDVAEKVVVRRKDPPFAYDDRGNPIEYTKEKLAELRGKDKTKPGYEAKYEDLASGQTVKLYLKAPEKKAKAKDDPKDEDTGVARPKVTMILILQEAASPLIQPDKKKKKDK